MLAPKHRETLSITTTTTMGLTFAIKILTIAIHVNEIFRERFCEMFAYKLDKSSL